MATTNCDVKQNAISYLKKKNVIDDRLFITSPRFYIENDKLTQYAKQKYGLKIEGSLFDRTRIVFKDVNVQDKYKVVPNDELFNELQERYDEVEAVPEDDKAAQKSLLDAKENLDESTRAKDAAKITINVEI